MKLQEELKIEFENYFQEKYRNPFRSGGPMVLEDFYKLPFEEQHAIYNLFFKEKYPGNISKSNINIGTGEIQVPALATGGIAYGPTLAFVGEYAGVSSNGEVIAPLEKLKEMIKDANKKTP